MKIIERGLICSNNESDGDRRVACYPGLTRLNDGRILCSFRTGRSKDGPDEKPALAQSRDEGRSWEQLPFELDTTLNGVPGSLSFTTIIETAPGEVAFFASWINRSDPTLPISHPETGGCLELKLVTSRSSDGGASWGPIREIPVPFPQPEVSGPVLALGPPGHLLLPMENQKHWDDPNPINEKCYALLSYDGGQTWPDWAMVAHDFPHRKFWCNRFTKLESNKLAAVSWTFDEKTQADLPLHITHGTPDGRTWDEPFSTGVNGQVSYLFPAADGALLMATSHRESPACIRLRRSTDEGRSWDGDGLLVFGAEGQASASGGDLADYYKLMTNYTFGWSPMLQLQDGSILLVHFAGSGDAINLHWVRIN